MDLRLLLAKIALKDARKQSKNNASTPAKNTSTAFKPKKESTFEENLSGCGCLLGIIASYFAITGGVSILQCLLSVVIISLGLSYIGKGIDWIIKVVKKNR